MSRVSGSSGAPAAVDDEYSRGTYSSGTYSQWPAPLYSAVMTGTIGSAGLGVLADIYGDTYGSGGGPPADGRLTGGRR